jgi:cytochrome b6
MDWLSRALQSLIEWLESRLHLGGRLQALLYKPIPIHRKWGFYLTGGACLFLLSLQIVTGLLMVVYYRPTPEMAHESIRRLMGLPFGWLVRPLHARGADFIILLLCVHMLTTFFLRAYRRPRELTWVTGFAIFLLALAFAFTGSMLPWGPSAPAAAGAPAPPAAVDISTADQLTLFYLTHIVLLPGAVLALVGVHLYLVQQHGMSVPVGLKAERYIGFFPTVVMWDHVVWLAIFGLLVISTVVFPQTLGPRIDWFFDPISETFRLLPARIAGVSGEVAGWAALILVALAWYTVPFWDRAAREDRHSWRVTLLGLSTVGWALAMIVRAHAAR